MLNKEKTCSDRVKTLGGKLYACLPMFVAYDIKMDFSNSAALFLILSGAYIFDELLRRRAYAVPACFAPKRVRLRGKAMD